MNRVKFIEILDRNTFIPAVAIDMSLSGNSFNDYLLRRAGYGETRCVLLTRVDGGKACYDPFDWGDRTFHVAHKYIAEEWDSIFDAEVIDVEYLLGETTKAKESERYSSWAA